MNNKRINDIIKGIKILKTSKEKWSICGAHPKFGGNDYSMLLYNSEKEAKVGYNNIIKQLKETINKGIDF